MWGVNDCMGWNLYLGLRLEELGVTKLIYFDFLYTEKRLVVSFLRTGGTISLFVVMGVPTNR